MELFLVLCLCVLTWTGKTFGDENGVNVTVSSGSDVLLPCSPTTKENLSFKFFKWRKDDQKEVFKYNAGNHFNNGLQGQDDQFKGRVSFLEDQLGDGNASIRIHNAMVEDSGSYSCEFPDLKSGSQKFQIKLVVRFPEVSVFEKSDAILPCSPIGNDNLKQQVFDWRKDDQKEVFLYDNGKHYNNGQRSGQHNDYKDRVEFFQDQLGSGNASIRIKNTKPTDSGIYSCTFPNLQPAGQKFYIKLVVAVCPKPTITIAEQTDAGVLVKCSVTGFPDVELFNSANEPVPAGTPQPPDYFFTVTKRDHYRCSATQKEYCHQTFSERTLVPIPGAGNGSFFSGVGVVVGITVAAVVVAAAIFYFLYRRKRRPSDKTNDGTNGVMLSSSNADKTEDEAEIVMLDKNNA
ncbi:uncharacterized protein FYW61_002046 [Anableps anableps]